jgi:hypothetical protein
MDVVDVLALTQPLLPSIAAPTPLADTEVGRIAEPIPIWQRLRVAISTFFSLG